MCPYTKKHSGKSSTVRVEVLKSLEPWEKRDLDKFREEILDNKTT
tara:strand:+ start:1923 stop:2057 length:135 start_codon:yes stop_codon:yes gene_type:complete